VLPVTWIAHVSTDAGSWRLFPVSSWESRHRLPNILPPNILVIPEKEKWLVKKPVRGLASRSQTGERRPCRPGADAADPVCRWRKPDFAGRIGAICGGTAPPLLTARTLAATTPVQARSSPFPPVQGECPDWSWCGHGPSYPAQSQRCFPGAVLPPATRFR